VRLLLDEMLSPAIAGELRARGYDVEAIKEHADRSEIGQRAYDDPQVLDLARLERRAIVTDNLVDMRPLHYEAIVPGGSGDYGMLFIPGGYPRRRADTGKIVTALQEKLDAYPGERDLADGEDWL
jgi:hypothetical protein